jgi:hypothetical protein
MKNRTQIKRIEQSAAWQNGHLQQWGNPGDHLQHLFLGLPKCHRFHRLSKNHGFISGELCELVTFAKSWSPFFTSSGFQACGLFQKVALRWVATRR